MQMKFLIAASVIAGFVVSTSPAKADTGHFPTGPARDAVDAFVFEQVDDDGDGYLSEDELADTTWSRFEMRFDRLDIDGDGALSKIEYNEAMKSADADLADDSQDLR